MNKPLSESNATFPGNVQYYDQFVGGEFIPSIGKEYFPLISPETGNVVAQIANSKPEDVAHAVSVAKSAFKTSAWRQDKSFRIRCLRNLAGKMRDNLAHLVEAESKVTGRPIREMRAQLSRLPEWYEYFASVVETLEDTVPPFGAGYLNYTLREPLGVVGLLTPWNHPLLILTKKLAPALAAGNAVVIKPSEQAPSTVNMLGKLIKETEIPHGIVNIIHGYGSVAGKALSENADLSKVDLTGGTPTGRNVASSAGQNLIKVAAELGGKASVIICEDASMSEAVNAATFAGYIASGQTCVQGARILVPETKYEQFIEQFLTKVQGLKVGPPMDEHTDIGPIVSERQRDRILEYVRVGVKEGAKLVHGGQPLDKKGWYMSPAVFTDVTNDMTIAQEEIFGPVVCVMKYSTEEEAIELANGTDFGLAMSVWTNDVRRAHRIVGQLEAGVIWINDHHRIDPSSPWGGYKDSGLGRENGIDCYKDYTQIKNVIVNTNPEPFDWFDGTATNKRYS